MPLGEFVAEVVLRPIIEKVVQGVSYFTGFVVLKICTLGSVHLAPLDTLHERNGKKKKWYRVDWSIWLDRPKHARALKAECTCLVGVIIWFLIGFLIYLKTR